MLLTVVLAGDQRLPQRFRSEDLLPLGSRMQVRLLFESATPDELLGCLQHRLKTAGNPKLITPDLQRTLCEHAAGNYRTLLNLAGELLAAGVQQEVRQLDEKLFLETFTVPKPPKPKPKPPQNTNRRRR
jgi:type II secretory pathway predicted ATPase ExeA